MRIPGARRFQTGGMNPAMAAGIGAPTGPSGVNPMPPINPGGPQPSPFQAGAPAAGLGAAAPGLNPAAIQQAVAARRMQSGMGGMPGAAPGGMGMPPRPVGPPPAMPPANPLAQQMQARGAMPTPVPMGPPPAAPPAASPAVPPAGLMGALPPPALGGPAPGAPPNPLPGAAPQMAGLGMAKGGRVRKFNSTAAAAENLPTHPGAAKKAKGGVIKRKPSKPKKAALPPPPPLQAGPPPVGAPDMGGDAGPAAGPGLPAGAVPGMAKGGKWLKDAIKKPGALHKDLGVPKGEKIPEKKLAKAAKSKGKVGERARLAEKMRGFKKNKGGKCDKMAAGGAAKQRRGFPNTQKPPARFAEGGKVRGCGVAQRGCNFSGIY